MGFDEEVAVRCLLALDVGGASLRRFAGGVLCELLDSGAIIAVAAICKIEEPSPAEQILGKFTSCVVTTWKFERWLMPRRLCFNTSPRLVRPHAEGGKDSSESGLTWWWFWQAIITTIHYD